MRVFIMRKRFGDLSTRFSYVAKMNLSWGAKYRAAL